MSLIVITLILTAMIMMIKVTIMIVIVMKSPLGQAQTRIKVMINQCAYVVGSCYHI